MVNALSASLVNSVAQSAFAARAGVPANISAFGPDFLLSVYGGGSSSGSAYTSNGASYAPPASSPQGRARTAALSEARSALLTRQFADARAAAQTVLDRNPDDVTALYFTGRSYLEQGDFSQAARFLSRASELSGDQRIAADLRATRWLSGGSDEALRHVNRLISQRDTQAEGLRLATYLLQSEPQNLDARMVLVDFHQSQGRLNLAGAELLDALESATKEQSSTLLARLEKFVEAHPYDAGSHDLLAQGYAKFGRLDDAEAQFSEALRLLNDDPQRKQEIREDYADVLSRAGRAASDAGREAEARTLFRRAIDLVRDDERRNDLAGLEYAAGDRSLRAGNLRFALASLEQSRINFPVEDKDKLKDKLIAAYQRLATRFGEQNDLKRVADALNGAFLLDAADDDKRRAVAEAHVAYGHSLAADGDYYAAIKAYRAATKLYSDDATYAGFLADALSHVT